MKLGLSLLKYGHYCGICVPLFYITQKCLFHNGYKLGQRLILAKKFTTSKRLLRGLPHVQIYFLIGYSSIFLVLMSLGVALSKLKVFSFKETLLYSITRVIIGPIVGFGFVKFFKLSGVEAGVMFIQASMPSAVLTYLIADIYSSKKISNIIASTVALSTFMSFFTLVVVVFISLKYFN